MLSEVSMGGHEMDGTGLEIACDLEIRRYGQSG